MVFYCNKVLNENEFHFRFISRLAQCMMAAVGTCPIKGGQLGRGGRGGGGGGVVGHAWK